MKLTIGILATAMMVGGAWAQSPDAIDNARSTAKSLQQKQDNAAPKAIGVPAKAKPAPGAPAPAVKLAAIPGSAPTAAKPAAATSSHNQLQKVNVVPGADGVQIEIRSSQAVTPRVSKLNSPARVVVELPETMIASSQNKIPVGSAGVKGVRIGMDGKTPPTTSVVVDLEKPLSYQLTTGPAGEVILSLNSQGAAPSLAKNGPAPAMKSPMVAVKAPAPAPKAVAPAVQTAVKPVAAPAKSATVAAVKAPAVKPAAASKQVVKATAAEKTAVPAAAAAAAKQTKPEEKKWAMSGKRDPFFSPVVQTNGSGCSTGKKCLEIGAINLRGVVRSETGFIAVVTNNLNKAYFLRENDPVFNGYVVKITGDSVVFQETIQDKLGKSFTREVVKRIFTPAV